MNIQNVRMGFNTSSSSDHSFVLNPTVTIDPPDNDYFGWEDFTLKSKQSKEYYFATLLLLNLTNKMSHEYATYIVNGLFNKKIIDVNDLPGIDHGSVYTFPTIKPFWEDIDEVNIDFFNEFKDYIVNNENLVICGGSDNGDSVNYGGEKDPRLSPLEYFLKDRSGPFVARKDGEFWVLFNKRNGTKIRMSFSSDENYTQSSYPESADIKITDFCPFACDFCYQDSSLEGAFAHPKNIQSISQTLHKLGVFEVALGGGEPTTHPFLDKIINMFYEKDICTNLTTRSIKWITDTSISTIILEKTSGLAFSVGSNYMDTFNLKELSNWLTINKYKGELSAHYILGLVNTGRLIGDIKSMSKHVNRITLLGGKNTGRAKEIKYQKVNIEKVIKHCQEEGISLGMDTKAIQDYKEDLDRLEIPEILRTSEEGKFSLYIDAVESFIARDSYSKEATAVNFNYERGENEHNLENVIKSNFPF